jgi:hypothetical protein
MEVGGQFHTKDILPPLTEPKIPTRYALLSTGNASDNILNGSVFVLSYGCGTSYPRVGGIYLQD